MPSLNLSQRMTQNLVQRLHLVLNPRMLQLLKTLNLPYSELMDSINKEIEENPALEYEKHDELIEYAKNLSTSRGERSLATFDEDRPDREIKERGPSLQQHLLSQVNLEDLDEDDQQIAEYIINNIDERGYVVEYPKVRDEIMKQFKVKKCNVDKVLEVVQTLEPDGVGARNIKESLLLQVREYNFESDELKQIIHDVLKYHFESLAKKNFEKIAEDLEIELDGVQYIANFVEKNLNPAPGLSYKSNEIVQTIIPSFIIERKEQDEDQSQDLEGEDGEQFISRNLEEEKGPRLRLNQKYLQMLDDPKSDEKTKEYLKERMEAARIFIDNIAKRHQTIQKIINNITNTQQEFFDKGYYWLNPLQQNKLAGIVGVHPSTISRAVSTKYAETPQGLYPLKYMCPRNVKGFSAMQIKGIMRCILKDNKKMSDQKIADFLYETRGVDIKRRTVTKYRMELGETSSYERKKEDNPA